MTQLNDNRIIAPPIEEEVYPYRRVWRSISIQVTLMCITTLSIFFMGDILGIQLDNFLNNYLSYFLAIIPALLWIVFSVLPERTVLEPRLNLITIAIISALAAAAIGIPLVENVFHINEWLPLESALQRILGFTFTVGIVDTSIKFIVVRYFAFPQYLRIRTDTIAYCVASAIGYSVVANLYIISELQALYSISMIHIFANYVLQMASCLFLAYGFSSAYFNNSVSIILPINILLAAIVIGIISPFVTGLMNGPLSTGGNADRPIFSLGFLIAILLVCLSVTFFLYSVAEQREREAFSAGES